MADTSLLFHQDSLWLVARSMVGSGRDPVAAGLDIEKSLGIAVRCQIPVCAGSAITGIVVPCKGNKLLSEVGHRNVAADLHFQ